MEFVDLQPVASAEYKPTPILESSYIPVETFDLIPNEDNKSTLNKPILEPAYTPVETFDLTPNEDKEECGDGLCVRAHGVDSHILCPDKSGFFKLDNLFGELRTEYDKAVARKNLGIASKDLLTWGNVLGNLVNQKDLVKFITEQISTSEQSILDIVQKQIDELDTQSSITTIYYGPGLENMSLSNSTTFKTGDYDGNIVIVSPKYPTNFIVNGLRGGFDYVGPMEISGERYYQYKSKYSNLGATEITVTYG